MWYHGTNRKIPEKVSQLKLDRTRGEADPNAEGPGWYWTSSKSDASRYGTRLYKGEYQQELGLLSSKAETNVDDLELLATEATREQRLTFVQNWGHEKLYRGLVADIIRDNYSYGTMLENMVGLYHDLFQYDARRYVSGAELIADGVIIQRPEVKHLVLWNLTAMVFEEVQ